MPDPRSGLTTAYSSLPDGTSDRRVEPRPREQIPPGPRSRSRLSAYHRPMGSEPDERVLVEGIVSGR